MSKLTLDLRLDEWKSERLIFDLETDYSSHGSNTGIYTDYTDVYRKSFRVSDSWYSAPYIETSTLKTTNTLRKDLKKWFDEHDIKYSLHVENDRGKIKFSSEEDKVLFQMRWR